ncbi:TerB family tellurite resistance protein [Mucilaginibacter litoreus]|uniref:TerB family tellurite resistance protein n=1 Tax=Mucilaginibacter litoreus TaxID=1048221 RepID=A0ABW3AMM1_9SPHI
MYAVLSVFVLIGGCMRPAQAQSYEVQQLLLDIEKLSQFKSILSDMEKGYTILSQGYGQVKNLTQGNFSLHQVFLDGLLLVNPEVRKYKRVADIITAESSILSEYKAAYRRFGAGGLFNAQELGYLSNVYAQLTKRALRNASDLTDVLTDSKLRMSDEERLSAIDRIWADTSNQLAFLRSFNRRTSVLQLQRQKELNDTRTLQQIYRHEKKQELPGFSTQSGLAGIGLYELTLAEPGAGCNNEPAGHAAGIG